MSVGGASSGRPYAVLVVCTGNICRSPVAERLLRAQLADPGLAVSSAGTRALRGEPVAAPMAELLGAAGADADGFRARQLDEGLLRAADLVLTMTRAHRAGVVELWPPAVRRSFTLLELARLVQLVPAEDLPTGGTGDRWDGLRGLAAARRHEVRAAAADDVADPYRGSAEDYRRAFDQISRAVRTLVDAVGASAPPAVPAAAAGAGVTGSAGTRR